MHSLSGSGSSVSYTQCGVYTALKAVNPVSSMEYIVAFFLFVFFFLPLFFSFFLFHLGNFQMLCFTPIFTPFSWREEERKKKKTNRQHYNGDVFVDLLLHIVCATHWHAANGKPFNWMATREGKKNMHRVSRQRKSFFFFIAYIESL